MIRPQIVQSEVNALPVGCFNERFQVTLAYIVTQPFNILFEFSRNTQSWQCWQKPIGASTKVKLNIPQLTFVKSSQPERHQSVSQKVPGSIPTGGNFFAELIFALHYVSNTNMSALPTLCITGKLYVKMIPQKWLLNFL